MLGRRVASTRLDLPREVVFTALAECGSFACVPGISHCQVLAQEGDVTVAELVWPLFFADQKFVVEFINNPPESVIYAQTDQFRQRGLSGRWDLKADGTGTVLTGEMKLWTGLFDVWANRRKLRSALNLCLETIARRSKTSGNLLHRLAGDETRSKILEIVRCRGALEIRFNGEVYRLEKQARDQGP